MRHAEVQTDEIRKTLLDAERELLLNSSRIQKFSLVNMIKIHILDEI